jgi:vacuolar-type H+-ATPase subunit H
MKDQIQQKIIEMIGEDSTSIFEEDNICEAYNQAKQDLRTKAPQLAQEIVDMVEEEIEKHKARNIDSIKEPFVKIALEARNDGLNEIINLLKK